MTTFPHTSFFYLGLLVGLYFLLTLTVTTLRGITRVEFGSEPDSRLGRAVRAHAQFFEYVPVIAVMVIGLEWSGVADSSIAWLMGTLLLGRTAHAIGFLAPQHSLIYWSGRAIGNVTTLGLLATTSVWAVMRFTPA
ncbi:MAG: MAPEG family protein [Gammaproteobacteria bacterium]|nr:MAPEG family protein [Gammaproteobacteria bacterium]